MKIYSISRFAFWGICLLILLLPVSRHWRLLSLGGKATGTVQEYTLIVHQPGMGEKTLHYANRVSFHTGDSACATHGPLDYEMAPGRSVAVRYNPENPSDCCLLTFAAFYLHSYTTLSICLLILWGAFYLSFNYYRKSPRKGSRTPARAPYGRRHSRLNP
ncbi:MAG: DUF3592 domain-containing protein [Bacteroidota bacterium]